MKLGEIYKLAVEKGMENDPRGKDAVQKTLAQEKQKYEEMKPEEKQDYDLERLINPYDDTRILTGETDLEVKRALVGIDMEIGEVLLADALREKGCPVELIISHHPEGKALAALYQVMHLQEDVLARFGVPINVAESLMSSRISEVKRNLLPLNHNRAVDAAKILNLAFLCVHTPADNHVVKYLQSLMDEKKPETLKDIIKILKEIPEYAAAAKINAGPAIIIGANERRAGKIMVDMTGGTSGSEDIYIKLAEAGLGTLLVMHITEKHREKAEKSHVNVICAGHMASDSLGMNLFLDVLEAQGIEIKPCAGLLRHSRL